MRRRRAALDRANQGHDKLMQARDQLLDLVHKDVRLEQVRANGLDDEPQYQFNVNWEKASAVGLTITDINNTLSAAWGSQFVDDFIDRGRVTAESGDAV
jgi:multidrug efflux pump subunit AcrB